MRIIAPPLGNCYNTGNSNHTEGADIMLTFERVFETFADYLAGDADREIVKVRHGYLSLLWDNNMGEYVSFMFCQTPEELLNELASNYTGYLEWQLCADKDKPTEAECAEVAEKVAEIRAKCLDGLN